jgi:uncharacterized protein (DUF362 family)
MIQSAGYADCREAVNLAFELFPVQIAGKKVLIKPNVLRASKAEEHIVTNPALLKAVVEKVEEMQPAEVIVGDNPALCTACGACIEQCPVSALAMKNDLPEADPYICITCFCCQEICPEKAMSLK